MFRFIYFTETLTKRNSYEVCNLCTNSYVNYLFQLMHNFAKDSLAQMSNLKIFENRFILNI